MIGLTGQLGLMLQPIPAVLAGAAPSTNFITTDGGSVLTIDAGSKLTKV